VQPAAARLAAEPASESSGALQVAAPEPAYVPAPHGTGAAAPPAHAYPAGHSMTRAGSPTQNVPTGQATPAATSWSLSPTSFMVPPPPPGYDTGALPVPGSHA
jgi:hypothetical protein